MTKLTYSEASAVLYGDSDAGLTLTPEQQSLAMQAVAVFLSPYNWSDYKDFSDDIDAWVASTLAALLDTEVPPMVEGRDSEVNCWVHEAAVVSGNALAVSADTGQFHNVIGLQNTPTINSKLRWTRYMAKGVWSFAYLYGRRTNGGIIDIYVTPPFGSTVIALNDYDTRGTTLANQFARGTFTIAESGEQTIEIEVVATSSGSNYGNTFTLLQMWRTGD